MITEEYTGFSRIDYSPRRFGIRHLLRNAIAASLLSESGGEVFCCNNSQGHIQVFPWMKRRPFFFIQTKGELTGLKLCISVIEQAVLTKATVFVSGHGKDSVFIEELKKVKLLYPERLILEQDDPFLPHHKLRLKPHKNDIIVVPIDHSLELTSSFYQIQSLALALKLRVVFVFDSTDAFCKVFNISHYALSRSVVRYASFAAASGFSALLETELVESLMSFRSFYHNDLKLISI